MCMSKHRFPLIAQISRRIICHNFMKTHLFFRWFRSQKWHFIFPILRISQLSPIQFVSDTEDPNGYSCFYDLGPNSAHGDFYYEFTNARVEKFWFALLWKMKATFHRFIKIISGWLLVTLGVIGWFLPILPGTLFVVLGFTILSSQSDWVQKMIASLILRYPRQAAKLQTLKENLIAKVRKENTYGPF